MTRHSLCKFNTRGLQRVKQKCIVGLLTVLPRIAIKAGRAFDIMSGQGYRRQIHTRKRGKQANEVNKLIIEMEREKEEK